MLTPCFVFSLGLSSYCLNIESWLDTRKQLSLLDRECTTNINQTQTKLTVQWKCIMFMRSDLHVFIVYYVDTCYPASTFSNINRTCFSDKFYWNFRRIKWVGSFLDIISVPCPIQQHYPWYIWTLLTEFLCFCELCGNSSKNYLDT